MAWIRKWQKILAQNAKKPAALSTYPAAATTKLVLLIKHLQISIIISGWIRQTTQLSSQCLVSFDMPDTK
jgi:hypothetical protein